MRTIFISSFHVLISRNILASPVLDLLKKRGDIRIVLLVPEAKKQFFVEEFGGERVVVEGVARHLGALDTLFRYLALAAVRTRTLAIKRATEMRGSGEWLSRIIGGRPLFRRCARILDRWFAPRGPFPFIIERYRPDVVLSTDVQNEQDVQLLHAARDRGLPAVGMVRSWDNLTAKGLTRVIPEILIVNNKIVRAEAVRFHGVPERIIRVVGIPHYDSYPAGVAHNREEFSKLLGLDPAKRFIIYAPTGDRYLNENRVDQHIVEFLSRIIPPTHQLIVRMPPADSVLLDVSLLPNVVMHRPGKQFGENPNVFKNNELTSADDEILRDTLAYSDLLIAGPSTIVIDAAVFDKPIILVSFDGTVSLPYYRSIRRYYDYDHFQPILKSGGVRLAKNAGELEEWMVRYLKEPALDRAGRTKIVSEQCWKLDSQSSARLVAVLLPSVAPPLG